ncbi:MAG: hypothetical protein N2561_00260 [Bacteroidetes bacterium]|nr:hypothetical protein [Bacteroidota bacterium]
MLFKLRGPCLLASLALSCSAASGPAEPDAASPLLNFRHLEHLSQELTVGGVRYRIVRIYAEAPDYRWVGDPDEGIACLDDAARAAVLYLRHYELTGAEDSRQKAEALLRFVMYLQREDGLFYNFVWDEGLRINTTHPNSRAEGVGWWAARAAWALGEGARVLAAANPDFAQACRRRLERLRPHLEALAARYPQMSAYGGRLYPTWLVGEQAADATSELLLGLVAVQRAASDARWQALIERFAEGIARMRWGSMNRFPWGAHASWRDLWHGWGNSQAWALVEAGRPGEAEYEARHFYSRLLLEGWMREFRLSDSTQIELFEQIAYMVRPVVMALLRLYTHTGRSEYAVMAGLAASWFWGNNPAGQPLYDPTTGRGYDGIPGPGQVNRNAGAESTIEALLVMLELERVPEARRWLRARALGPQQERVLDGQRYRYRLFAVPSEAQTQRVAIVLNLTQETLQVLQGAALEAFLSRMQGS